jgi:glycogen debranching enzyme
MTKKISKKVLEMLNNPNTVWGKNPELEQFWRDLASGKKVVLIYKDKTHKYVNLPNRTTKKYKSTLNEFQEDNNIIAILSSNPSQDAYEQYLYPKAKSKSVDYVIQYYNTYFKPILPGDKLRVPL